MYGREMLVGRAVRDPQAIAGGFTAIGPIKAARLDYWMLLPTVYGR